MQYLIKQLYHNYHLIQQLVQPQQVLVLLVQVLRLVPLAIKRICMRAVYALSGESKGCLNISNMGVVKLPDAMAEHVERFDFVIGVQYTYPNNCSVVTYGGKTYISMIRGIRETELERLFFSRLVELGIPVEVESD